MSYPLQPLRPSSSRYNRRNDGETININVEPSGQNFSPFSKENMLMASKYLKEKFSQKKISESAGESSGRVIKVGGSGASRTALIIFAVLFVIGIIIAILYFTGAFTSSKTIYGDTASCCGVGVDLCKNFEGAFNCADCNGCKSCDNAGL